MDNKALFFVLLILGIIISLAVNSDKKEKKEKSSDI